MWHCKALWGKYNGKTPWYCSSLWYFSFDSKILATKAEINEWNYIKLQSFYTEKEEINKTKNVFYEMEKIFANSIYNKELISKNIQRTNKTQ